MHESIRDFVANNKTDMDMAEMLVELIGLEEVGRLKPEFISSLVNINAGIEKDLMHLTANEGVEYLKILLLSYMAKVYLKMLGGGINQ